MSDEHVWHNESRENLRSVLKRIVLGEVRLAKRGHDDILELCRETYIQEDSPEREWAELVQFASEEISRLAAQHDSEKSTWPVETDCDRLDRVEKALRDLGILLWQASPCCDTCTRGELSDRIDAIDSLNPGFCNRLRGYAFFIDQNLPQMIADSTNILVYLAYGWISKDGSEVSQAIYASEAIGIAREVCECLSNEGFKPDWNGELSFKIGLSLNWQRRTSLE